MFVIKDTIHINAPIDRVFLLSTSVELVAQTLQMQPVKGKTSGLIVDGDRLEWRGWKFGLPQRHETLITAYDRPTFFQDTMASGRFAFFQHDHHFSVLDGHVLLSDIVRFRMPFGPLGRLVGKYILVPHVRDLVVRRFELLKRLAETDQGRQYLA